MLAILTDQLTSAGGPVLVVLFVLSIAAMAITVFKILQYRRLGVGRLGAARNAVAIWASGDRDRAMKEARSEHSPACAVVASAMVSFQRHPGDHERARELATQSALDQITEMTSHLRLLETIVQAAPMIGLLGTVVGMISAFGELSAGGGAVDPAALATGIWTALLTTAAGLGVAIPFYFVSTWLESRVDRERNTMESAIGAMLYSEVTPGVRAPAASGLRAGFAAAPTAHGV